MLHRPTRRRLALDTLLATGLTLLLAGQALGLTWQTPVRVSTSGRALAHDGVAASGSTVHIGYDEAWGGIRRAVYRRSTDGGRTFKARVTLSPASAEISTGVDIAASGSNVHTVWLEGKLGADGRPIGPWSIRHRRSADSGATWGPVGTLGTNAIAPRVERSGSIVLLTFTDETTGQVWLRRSTDGGATFKPKVQVGLTTNEPSTDQRDAIVSGAFGTSVAYLAFLVDWHTVVVRRSLDGGATWQAAKVVATDASGWGLQLAASGSKVLVGYETWDGTTFSAVVRPSIDKGATWRNVSRLAPAAAPHEFTPVLGYGGGTWYAAYEACPTTACKTTVVRLRTSTDASTWTTSELVSTGARPFNLPSGVVHVGGPVVVWTSSDGLPDQTDVLLRRKG